MASAGAYLCYPLLATHCRGKDRVEVEKELEGKWADEKRNDD